MAQRWTKREEIAARKQLVQLYVRENKTIGEIARILGLGQSSVFKRLLRLRIRTRPDQKPRYRNKNQDISIPERHSEQLAEFIGIMLGDGHLGRGQVVVTLGTKEMGYVQYVRDLVAQLFGIVPRYCRSKAGHYTIYIGSVVLVQWLSDMGLVHNKVREQVDVPPWCKKSKRYMRAVVRGLIDTDGSVYRLRFGVQISFCNRSLPLLRSVREILRAIDFHPSHISGYNVYLTRAADLIKYRADVGFSNPKHIRRFSQYMGGSDSGNSIAL